MKRCEDCKHENYCDWYFIFYLGSEYKNEPGKCPRSRKQYTRKRWLFWRPK